MKAYETVSDLADRHLLDAELIARLAATSDRVMIEALLLERIIRILAELIPPPADVRAEFFRACANALRVP